MGFDFAAKRVGSTKIERIGDLSEGAHEEIFLHCRNQKFRKILGDYYKTQYIFRGNELSELIQFLGESKQRVTLNHSFQLETIIRAIITNSYESVSVQGD